MMARAGERNKLADGFGQYSAFAATSQIWRNPLHNPDTGIKLDCFGAYCVNSTNRWRMQVRDFSRQTGTTLKRLVISRLYRLAAKQQPADEARLQSPHIRHFGLKPRRRSGYVDPLIAHLGRARQGSA